MTMSKPSFYAVIPASVRYDPSLSSSEKLFYAEITAMAEQQGYCWASNSYFADLYDVKNPTISMWVKNLKKQNHIVVEYQREGKQIKSRRIYPIQKIEIPPSENRKGGSQKIERGWSENRKENGTSNNTTSNNNYVQFVEFWNEVNNCQLRITDKKREQIRSRLRTFTEEEIRQSIRNRSQDEWINGDGAKFKTDWNSFWRNDEKVERYLKSNNRNPTPEELERRYRNRPA